jgi:uncharacterized lipoprotein YajG
MKKQLFKTALLLVALAAIFSGCATSQNSQQSASPTISGYISVGADKSFE